MIYVTIATSVTWMWYDPIFKLVMRPAIDVMKLHNDRFLFTSIPEAFMVQFQLCLIAGVIFASPLLTLELWGFVAPGLTKEEKRPLIWIAPLSILLFACGVMVCYLTLPFAFKWFYLYVNPEFAELRPRTRETVMFTMTMLLVFGVLFELPIFLMTLGKIGIVNSRMLKEQWRYAVVLISIVAAIATPSNDAMSMCMAGAPMVVLYFLSIILVRFVERKPR